MAAELWATNLLKIVITIVATHLTLTKVMPLVDKFFGAFIDKKATDALTSLLGVIVIIFAGGMVVEFILAINNTGFNYVAVIGPGFDLLLKFFEFLQWILLAVVAAAVLKSYKK